MQVILQDMPETHLFVFVIKENAGVLGKKGQLFLVRKKLHRFHDESDDGFLPFIAQNDLIATVLRFHILSIQTKNHQLTPLYSPMYNLMKRFFPIDFT